MKFLMFIIHHFIRPVWSFIIKLFCFNKSDNTIYKYEWNQIKSIFDLVLFFRKRYKYKSDGPNGLLDHDNSENEFFSSFGDCDDMARYSTLKLNDLGYTAYRIGLLNMSKGLKTWHYDCLFIQGNIFTLFNYGKMVSGHSMDECLKKLGILWPLFSGKLIYWRCWW